MNMLFQPSKTFQTIWKDTYIFREIQKVFLNENLIVAVPTPFALSQKIFTLKGCAIKFLMKEPFF